jgi:excisionase family DNA binding protein
VERLLSAKEVAEWLGVPLATLYQWRHRNIGPHGVRVGRHLRYRETDCLAWFEQQAERDPKPAA